MLKTRVKLSSIVETGFCRKPGFCLGNSLGVNFNKFGYRQHIFLINPAIRDQILSFIKEEKLLCHLILT